MTQNNTSSLSMDVIDLLLLFKRRFFLILIVPVVLALIAAVISFLLPKWYKGRAQIIPPAPGSIITSAFSGYEGVKFPAHVSSTILRNPNDIYVAMLRSRTLQDKMIERFKLLDHFGMANNELARLRLTKLSSIAPTKDGTMLIEFEDKDPKRAAEVVNAYIEELQSMVRTVAISEAAQRKGFYEKQFAKAKDDLTAVEVALKQNQLKTGGLDLSVQSTVSVNMIARLKGEIASKEVKLASLRTYAADNNPELRAVLSELAQLRSQLAKMESNDPDGVFIAPGNMPDAKLQLVTLQREFKYKEAIYDAIKRSYEVAKIDETKDGVLISILDKAVAPEEKSSPHRALIVLGTFLISLLLCFFAALGLEIKRRMKADANIQARFNAV